MSIEVIQTFYSGYMEIDNVFARDPLEKKIIYAFINQKLISEINF